MRRLHPKLNVNPDRQKNHEDAEEVDRALKQELLEEPLKVHVV